jgi:hypothetical protein
MAFHLLTNDLFSCMLRFPSTAAKSLKPVVGIVVAPHLIVLWSWVLVAVHNVAFLAITQIRKFS